MMPPDMQPCLVHLPYSSLWVSLCSTDPDFLLILLGSLIALVPPNMQPCLVYPSHHEPTSTTLLCGPCLVPPDIQPYLVHPSHHEHVNTTMFCGPIKQTSNNWTSSLTHPPYNQHPKQLPHKAPKPSYIYPTDYLNLSCLNGA